MVGEFRAALRAALKAAPPRAVFGVVTFDERVHFHDIGEPLDEAAHRGVNSSPAGIPPLVLP